VAEIVLEQVSKTYGDGTRAVTDLDLEIPDGELTVLVGPSGCGKSTVLLMVAGLEEVTQGTIRIGDQVVNDVVPKDRDIAMVFQNYALYPHMSVYRNMAFGLRMRKTSPAEIDRRVRDAARILGLTDDLLAKKPKQLSGGQRQRVAMGRAIVRNPRAFLMDEPLSNLDAKLRVEMRAEIAALQRELGVTTIYVTHDQTEAMMLGHNLALLHDGVLQQVGPPLRVYAEPANVFVAGFIGSPAMNFVEAQLSANGDGPPVVEFGGQRVRAADDVFSTHPPLRAFQGRNVLIGIRPEDMEDASLVDAAPVERRLTAAPGDEEHVARTSKPDETVFIARVGARTRAKEGDRIDLVVDAAAMHFFDPDTGIRIST
jgi:multiple sugar transport system ATP-binding protein